MLIPLISFALRFPDGRLDPRARWIEIAAWSAFIAGVAFYVLDRALQLAGVWGGSLAFVVVAEIPVVVSYSRSRFTQSADSVA